MPESETLLCNLEEIPDGGAKGFGDGSASSIFAIRQGEQVFVYRNCCPHAGTPLNWMPDRFLTHDRSVIICTTHGALFDIQSGECTLGPCVGQSLAPIAVKIRNNSVWLLPSKER